MHFSNFNVDQFLSDTWQKKPLLIKNPWTSWVNPLEPDELAGLACEDTVESRLIEHPDGAWAVENGPLPEDRFTNLGSRNSTLLVQAVDHYVPAVAALVEPFRFIPNWRIDDVMVSYANDNGGVGPHFDHYDVFLIQGLGRRRWQVGGMCDDTTELLPHDDLRLLANFEPTEEHICEPGDVLYIPPGFSHNGVAIGEDCMTYSMGFRAPSRSELIGYWADDLLTELTDDDRYADPGLKLQNNPGEISAAAIDQLHAMITEKIADREAFASWFGQFSSTPKYPDVDWRPEESASADQLRELLASGASLYRNPASRFSYIEQENEIALFVDGQRFACASEGEEATFARQICADNHLSVDLAAIKSEITMSLIEQLYNQGSVLFDEGD